MAARLVDLKNRHFIIILHILLSTLLFAQPADIRFEHLTVQDGLSDNRVLSIIQDSKGFMWFGTIDGLNRYDGYKFKTYKHDPNDSLSLPERWVQALYEDHSGELWIGTAGGGLYRYDRAHDSFIHYEYKKDNPNSICGRFIVTFFETDQHVLWIGCGNGLNKYNRESDNFTRYYPDENKEKLEANVNYVAAITQDRYGRLWIGTDNEGLFYYDTKGDTFIKYKPHPKYSRTFINQFTYNLLATQLDGKNYLWFNSFQYGLYKINLENDEITHYEHESDNPNSISDNRIRTIYQTGRKSNELWIGTEFGLDRFDLQTEKFIHFRHQSENSLSRNYAPVWSIFEDKSGLMWIGSGQGVDKFDPNSSKFKTIRQDAGIQEGLSGNFVSAIQESNGDRSVLWLGTDDGLYAFNRNSQRFTKYQHTPENINSLSNFITEIVQPQSGNAKVLWLSTMNGLNKFDLSTKRITRYYIPTKDPSYNEIYTLCEDKNGMIWIGTRAPYLYSFDPITEQFTRHSRNGYIRSLYLDSSGMLWVGKNGGGLCEFNPATEEERRYRHIEGDLKSISNDDISSILEDKNGKLWIGTSGGLNKFDRSTETFTCFDEKDGLISNKARAILEDSHGNLWISTDKGISKFNPNSKEFRNFTTSDGLHHNEFWRSSHINRRGEMFFGGRNGLTYFHPDSIKDDALVPPIVLTDFQIFNESVEPGQNSALKKQTSEVSEITLAHDQSIFSFEFAALEYRKPEKIKYAYMMENVDPDWVFTDASRRFVTYTHLDPGEYVFRVKASNSNGIWNQQSTSVRITIQPPWWKTWWAYSIYVALILGTLYGLRRYEISRQRYKHQMELEHVEAEKFQELDRMKSRFFANISHEFRTPLTLIKGPIERWLPKTEDKELRGDFEIMQRNTNRLLRLVNQLLDISRLESGKMKLRARPENIIELTRQLTMAFESLASVKDIELRFTGPEKPITVYLDREHFEKIITNLLSNALKFTLEGGSVIVSIKPSQPPITKGRSPDISPFNKGGLKGVEITVTDTGAGIPPEKLPHIFDRFYQADESYTKDSEGSGIGLALTKELVEAHHGEIRAESDLNKGTTFTIWLPIEKEHFKPEEIVAAEPPEGYKDLKISDSEVIEVAKVGESDSLVSKPSGGLKSAPLLLIVEDNPDVTTYISSFLEKDYRIITAKNGEKGLKMTLDKSPDLIISDVMMPVMDGFQLCRKLKSDQRISHIPLILLTARADMESKLEGLEFGADDYVTKPFDAKELSVRSKNLLEQRRRLREHFEREVNFQPAEITVNSMDEQFMQKVIELIEQHIDDPGFSAEKFSKEVGMSLRHLNRKLQALTGHSALDFIRTMRLKRAARLLQKRSDMVTQIAYQVGFNNPAYFAQCFRRLYGMSPSEYTARYSE